MRSIGVEEGLKKKVNRSRTPAEDKFSGCPGTRISSYLPDLIFLINFISFLILKHLYRLHCEGMGKKNGCLFTSK